MSTWVRDVEFVPKPRNRGNGVTRPHPAHLAKLAEIEEMNHSGAEQIGELTEKEFLVAGTALYLGEGTKSGQSLSVANTDPEVIRFFMAWARRFFEIDKSRWRGMLYLHDGLDLEAAAAHWAAVAGIPPGQFTKPYRAVPDVGIRHNKHEFGCFTARYTSTRVARAAPGPVPRPDSVEGSSRHSGVAQLAEQSAVNRFVVGSSPTPGATPP